MFVARGEAEEERACARETDVDTDIYRQLCIGPLRNCSRWRLCDSISANLFGTCLNHPNRTPTLNQTRADAPVTGLDPAQMCTSLTDAYRRIYHGISDACWTRRKLQALSGQTRRTRGRSTAPESALNNSRQPQYGASLTWNTLFPGGGKYLDSLQLWHSPICMYFNGYVNSTEGHPQHMDFKHSCREVLPDVIQARDSCTFLLSQPISFLRPLAETSIRLNCQRRAPRLPPSSGSDNLFSDFAPHSRASV